MAGSEYVYTIRFRGDQAIADAKRFKQELEAQLSGIKFKTNIDLGNLETTLRKVQQQAARTPQQILDQQTKRAMEKTVNDFQRTVKSIAPRTFLEPTRQFMQQSLAAPTQAGIGQINKLKDAIMGAHEATKKMGLSIDEWTSMGNVDRYMSALQAAQRKVWGIRGMGYQMQAYGRGMVFGGIGALAGMYGLAQQYEKFSGPLNKAARNLELTAELTSVLDSRLRELAGTVSYFTPEEQAEALYQWAAATGESVDSLTELEAVLGRMNQVQTLSLLGNVDNATAVQAITDVQAQYNMTVQDTEKIVGTYVKVAATSKAEVSDLAMAFSYAGARAEAANTSFSETAAAFSILSAYGQRGSRAGRGLARLFENLIAPSQSAKKAIDSLFMETFGRVDVLQDAEGRFVGLAQAIRVLTVATQDMTEMQRLQFLGTITTENAARVLIPLIDAERMAMDGNTTSIKAVADAYDGLKTEQGEAFAKMMKEQRGYDVSLESSADTLRNYMRQFQESFAGQAQLLRSEWASAMTTMGKVAAQTLLPEIRKMLNYVSDFAEMIEKRPWMMKAVLEGAKVAIKLGTLMYLLGKGLQITADIKAIAMAATMKRAADEQVGAAAAMVRAAGQMVLAAEIMATGGTVGGAAAAGGNAAAAAAAGGAAARGGGWKGTALNIGRAIVTVEAMKRMLGLVTETFGTIKINRLFTEGGPLSYMKPEQVKEFINWQGFPGGGTEFIDRLSYPIEGIIRKSVYRATEEAALQFGLVKGQELSVEDIIAMAQQLYPQAGGQAASTIGALGAATLDVYGRNVAKTPTGAGMSAADAVALAASIEELNLYLSENIELMDEDVQWLYKQAEAMGYDMSGFDAFAGSVGGLVSVTDEWNLDRLAQAKKLLAEFVPSEEQRASEYMKQLEEIPTMFDDLSAFWPATAGAYRGEYEKALTEFFARTQGMTQAELAKEEQLFAQSWDTRLGPLEEAVGKVSGLMAIDPRLAMKTLADYLNAYNDMFLRTRDASAYQLAAETAVFDTEWEKRIQAALEYAQAVQSVMNQTAGWSIISGAQDIWSDQKVIEQHDKYLAGYQKVLDETRYLDTRTRDLKLAAYDQYWQDLIQGERDTAEQSQQVWEDYVNERKQLLEQAESGFRGLVEEAFQPTAVTAQDWAATLAGDYEDKWDEFARRVRAAQAGSAQWDWMIPADVKAGGQAAIDFWAESTLDQFYSGMMPEEIDWDAFVAQFQANVAKKAARENLVDIAIQKLRDAGIKATDQQVLAALGLESPFQKLFFGGLTPEETGTALEGSVAAAVGSIDMTKEAVAPTTLAWAQTLSGSMSDELGKADWLTGTLKSWQTMLTDRAAEVEGLGAQLGNGVFTGMKESLESQDFVSAIASIVLADVLAALEQ